MIGYDYTERIAPSALKAAGCSVVSRYVTRLDWPKSLQRAEADDLRAAGVPIMCNFETTADRMKGGAAAGRADATEALQHMAVLGAPAGVTVWFSADWDVQPSEVPAVLAYLQAAAGVLGSKSRTGLYGGLRAVSAAADAGYPIWQTIAWSGGRWDSRALMRQIGTEQNVGGVQVDVNEVINLAALGAWGGPAPTPSPASTPTSTKDDDMPAFATGPIPTGAGARFEICPPPPNGGTAGWGDVWFSLAADWAADGQNAHVRVAAWVHGSGWTVVDNFALPQYGDRQNPFGGPLPTGTQKISVERLDSPDAPMAYLIEAVHK